MAPKKLLGYHADQEPYITLWSAFREILSSYDPFVAPSELSQHSTVYQKQFTDLSRSREQPVNYSVQIGRIYRWSGEALVHALTYKLLCDKRIRCHIDDNHFGSVLDEVLTKFLSKSSKDQLSIENVGSMDSAIQLLNQRRDSLSTHVFEHFGNAQLVDRESCPLSIQRFRVAFGYNGDDDREYSVRLLQDFLNIEGWYILQVKETKDDELSNIFAVQHTSLFGDDQRDPTAQWALVTLSGYVPPSNVSTIKILSVTVRRYLEIERIIAQIQSMTGGTFTNCYRFSETNENGTVLANQVPGSATGIESKPETSRRTGVEGHRTSCQKGSVPQSETSSLGGSTSRKIEDQDAAEQKRRKTMREETGERQVSEHGLSLLTGGERLNDDVINAYRDLLMDHLAETGGGDVYIANSFLMSKVVEGVESNSHSWKAWKGYRQITDPRVRKTLLPNHSHTHWSLILADKSLRTYFLVDSMGQQNLTASRNAAVKAMFPDYDVGSYPGVPRQANSIDCGVFVLWFMRQIIKAGPLTPMPSVRDLRSHFAAELRANRIIEVV
eukprot:Clim_evm75s134 gene=Clim_evmTU75s134